MIAIIVVPLPHPPAPRPLTTRLLAASRTVDGEVQRRPLQRPLAADVQVWLGAEGHAEHLHDHSEHARVAGAALAFATQRRTALPHLE